MHAIARKVQSNGVDAVADTGNKLAQNREKFRVRSVFARSDNEHVRRLSNAGLDEGIAVGAWHRLRRLAKTLIDGIGPRVVGIDAREAALIRERLETQAKIAQLLHLRECKEFLRRLVHLEEPTTATRAGEMRVAGSEHFGVYEREMLGCFDALEAPLADRDDAQTQSAQKDDVARRAGLRRCLAAGRVGQVFMFLVHVKDALELLDHIAAHEDLTAVRCGTDARRTVDHGAEVVHAVVDGIDLTHGAAPVHAHANAQASVQERAVVRVHGLCGG